MKREKVLETILVIVAGILIISLISKIKALNIVALGLLVLTLVSPFAAEKIAWLWFKLAHIMGRINTFILLFVIFYLFLTPLAFIFRLFNHDNLMLRKKQRDTYYTERNHNYSAGDFENIW